MSTRFTKLCLSACAAAVIVSTSAEAGVGSSGGGKGVVCRNFNGKIIQSVILDLYEAVNEQGIKLRDSFGSLDQDYGAYVHTLRGIEGDSRPVDNELMSYLHETVNHINFTGTGGHLPVTPDVGQVPSFSSACRLEQIAVYHDDSDVLEVDSELWASLDSLNQAALIAHEEIYKLYRRAGDVTSKSVRSLVGRLFSTVPPNSVWNGVPGSAIECWANTSNPSTHDTLFDVFQDPQRPSSTVLNFRRIGGRDTFSQVKISFPVSIDLQKLTRYKLPVTVIDTSANFSGSTQIAEGQFRGFVVSLSYQYRKPFALSITAPDGTRTHNVNVDYCFK